MSFNKNPFMERMYESTSDEEFVQLFSPKILEKLEEGCFEGGVHIFHSPPGAGKSTLLRVFTPTVLNAFWKSRIKQLNDGYNWLERHAILDEKKGPQVLGVLLSCASGYADLPSSANIENNGLFRALFDCRVVLRTLRCITHLIDNDLRDEQLDQIELKYDGTIQDLKVIPPLNSVRELIIWAEKLERQVYSDLDSIAGSNNINIQFHHRFESILWLQSVNFVFRNQIIAPKRHLLVDDLHKLKKRHRLLLIEEITDSRPKFPIWLAQREIALGDEFLVQGVRQGRDIRHTALEKLWSDQKGQNQYQLFAENVLERRLNKQQIIPPASFTFYLNNSISENQFLKEIQNGYEKKINEIKQYKANYRYSEIINNFENLVNSSLYESLIGLYVKAILLVRDEKKQQTSMQIFPLTEAELEQKDKSSVQNAAEIFINNELKIPYYFGFERMCIMSTYNIDELLNLAGALFDSLKVKQLQRKRIELNATEQEKIFKDVVKKKRLFIPRNHTEGTRAQRLIDAIGSFCKEKTFLPNAPYAPGVTGVRIAEKELKKLNEEKQPLAASFSILKKVLFESVAENLFFIRESSASTGREGGVVFYLNRTLCVHYGLPLQFGGWQDVNVLDLYSWMENGRIPQKRIF